LIPNPGGAKYAAHTLMPLPCFALIPNPGGAKSLCVTSSLQAGYQS
jgi:hypothetical protein